ncbi:WD40 repeat-like protein [Canariomyces notabilis]|uniref:Mitochondrial division protein 1 n=1 Tax=Canariomyces notabilis TaxID=2074819 RepID=A0AAN6QHF5_9PEZI|nr:WD40 repeat-like protein [Canariomyces arenarius]
MDHCDSVKPVAFSQNSRILAARSQYGYIELWDTITWERHKKLEPPYVTYAVAFSSDSKLLMLVLGPRRSESAPYTIELRDTATWELRRTIDDLHGDSEALFASFSPSTKLLGLALSSRLRPGPRSSSLVRVYDTDTWQWQEIDLRDQSLTVVDSCAFSHDSKILALRLSDNTLRFWDTFTWKPLEMLVGLRVTCVSFSSSDLLALGSNDRTIQVWDIGPAIGTEIRARSKLGKAKKGTSWKPMIHFFRGH